MLKRALISVFDKTGLEEMARFLVDRNVELVSTGGTFRFLVEKGIPVTEVNQVTGFDEIMDGRVKTLHPNIHAGILCRRDNSSDMEIMASKNITPIDLVIVNLYPFFEKYKADLEFEEKLEFIDIGGPTMIRAAAKNFRDVIVLSSPGDYPEVISMISQTGDVDFASRRKFAGKVFNLMSAYDAAVSRFLLEDEFPEYLAPVFKKHADLRYGENPHQKAAFYGSMLTDASMNSFTQLQGKELSYNNFRDMDIAWKTVSEFEDTACCGLKHNTPCGAAVADTLTEAYRKTFEGDPVSIFGGIVAVNRPLDGAAAREMVKTFLEVVVAPSFEKEALEVFSAKKNLRLIQCESPASGTMEMVTVDGGILVQGADTESHLAMDTVTEASPSEDEIEDMIFGEIICKYVKSNAIVVVKDMQVLGVGAGQVNRIWAAEQALERALSVVSGGTASDKTMLKGAVLVSDAFFPFPDVVEKAAEYGIRSILQPGGSVNDNKSVEACNNAGISMVFTGTRHFKH